MMEIHQAAKVVTDAVDSDARIIFGAVNDSRLKKGEIKITVIAAGFGDGRGQGSSLSRKEPFRTISTVLPESVFKKAEEKEVLVRQVPVTSGMPPVEKKQEQKAKTAFAPEVTKIPDDGWDIPAFIRRKRCKRVISINPICVTEGFIFPFRAPVIHSCPKVRAHDNMKILLSVLLLLSFSATHALGQIKKTVILLHLMRIK